MITADYSVAKLLVLSSIYVTQHTLTLYSVSRRLKQDSKLQIACIAINLSSRRGGGMVSMGILITGRFSGLMQTL